jgi:cbb3-type cytochrome oxidase cytochrome c subunit
MSDAKGKSGMEIIALIAYMQRLGTDIKSGASQQVAQGVGGGSNG